MQVAKQALRTEPYIIKRSIDNVKHHLQSIRQLTDPPLDLNAILHNKSKILRSTPAIHAQMAQWLRTNLQLSEEDLRHCLSKDPGILKRSSVGRFIMRCAHIRAPLAALFVN